MFRSFDSFLFSQPSRIANLFRQLKTRTTIRRALASIFYKKEPMRVMRTFAALAAFAPCAVLAGAVPLIQLVPEDPNYLTPRYLHPRPENEHMNSSSPTSQILHGEIALEPKTISELPLLVPSQMDTQHVELPPASMVTNDSPDATAPTALTSETLNKTVPRITKIIIETITITGKTSLPNQIAPADIPIDDISIDDCEESTHLGPSYCHLRRPGPVSATTTTHNLLLTPTPTPTVAVAAQSKATPRVPGPVQTTSSQPYQSIPPPEYQRLITPPPTPPLPQPTSVKKG